MKKNTGVLIVLMVFSFFSNQVLSQTRDRSEIADQYKWDLTDLYPSEEAFQKAKDA